MNLDMLRYIEEALLPKKVHVGMVADDVLKLHPKNTMVEEPEVVGYDEEAEGYIVWWKYKEFELRLERVVNEEFPLGVYAVQEIRNYENEENNPSSDD